MERKNGILASCLMFALCLLLVGCVGGLLEEVPKEFSYNGDGSRSGASAETAEKEGLVAETGEPSPEVKVKTLEENNIATEDVSFSFLEEGSRFARSGLSETEKLWYGDMERILGSYGSGEKLSREGLAAGLNEDSIDKIFQCVLNDHPELFYVDGYSYTKYTRYGREDEILSVEFSGRYNVDPETAKKRRGEIRAAVGPLLEGIDSDASQYEKVKYVYDILIRETDYQIDAPDNQNIYSVFVNHRSVCQGYAKATQYLLNRLGVECALVLGSVGTGEGHAWNLVNVDGSYYYVDTTWGDASYQMEDENETTLSNMPEINYDYLNVTTAELLRTHALDGQMQMPLCDDTAANYYVREGALFTGYDREQMTELFDRMLGQGRNDITVKCATQESYSEIYTALIENQEIFGYLAGLSDTVAYSQNETQLSLTFWVTNEQ